LEIVYSTFLKVKKVLFLMQNLNFLFTFSLLTSAQEAPVNKTLKNIDNESMLKQEWPLIMNLILLFSHVAPCYHHKNNNLRHRTTWQWKKIQNCE